MRAASASSLQIDFAYRGERCREKLKLPPTPANRKYVERLKATILHEITTGAFDYAKHFPNSKRMRRLARLPGQAITVADALNDWLDHMQGEVEKETWSEYDKDIKRHLVPQFGSNRLADPQMRSTVKKWATESPLSRKRLNNILIPLRSMYKLALDEDPPLVERNPLQDFEIKKPRTARTKDKIDPFAQDEVAAVIGKCEPGLANLVDFWVWSGLRTGEVLAVEWQDVDFIRGTIRVSRALREGRIKAPKTEAGERDVKLLPPAKAALDRQKALTYLAGGRIFLNPRTGEPWAGDGAFRKTAWVYALKRAGVRYRYPNQLRHTFASWMLSAGENPLWVAKQMGHRDWSQIVKTYGKWIPDVDPLAGERAVGVIMGDARKEGAK